MTPLVISCITCCLMCACLFQTNLRLLCTGMFQSVCYSCSWVKDSFTVLCAIQWRARGVSSLWSAAKGLYVSNDFEVVQEEAASTA